MLPPHTQHAHGKKNVHLLNNLLNCVHVAACVLLTYVLMRGRALSSRFVVVHRQSNAVLCTYVQQVTGTCTTHAYATATIRYQEVHSDSHIVWKQHTNQGLHTTSNVHIMCHLLRSCIQCTRDAEQVGMPGWYVLLHNRPMHFTMQCICMRATASVKGNAVSTNMVAWWPVCDMGHSFHQLLNALRV